MGGGASKTTPDATEAQLMKAHLEQTLQPALVALCRARPEDPVTWLAEYLLAH